MAILVQFLPNTSYATIMIMNLRYLVLGALMMSSVSWAQTYICLHDGKPVYTTVKLNKSCTPSQMNGIASASQVAIANTHIQVSSEVALASASEPTKTVPEIIDDQISQIWTKNELGSFDDTVILPPAPKLTITSIPLKTNVRFPKIANMRHAKPTIAAPVVQPPQLTRRQILQQELNREKAALVRTQASLKVAQNKKDSANIQRYETQIRDRQLNIQALEQEIKR